MGQALYRKYRSKSLKEVIGQEHITKTLEHALKQNRISHAYLFTGPRGVGKTSVARILAHEINGLPYKDDSSDIDIIEIDAASNRRIDEIRELRDKVHIAPTSSKYKVYIIDEVHMLTREAFNALLKTLEEPPEHVIFILATTDIHKLPETIVSRTQRFNFKPAETSDLITLLKQVAKAEKIPVTEKGITLLAEHSDGSFRDALSLLDQARSHTTTEVNEKTVQELLGLPSAETIQALFSSITKGEGNKIVNALDELYSQGFQAATVAKQLGQLLRADIIKKPDSSETSRNLELLGKLVEVPAAYDPERYLEIILLQAIQDKPKPTSHPETALPSEEIKQAEEPLAPTPQASQKKPTELVEPTKALSNDELWSALLLSLKQKHNTLYSIVRMAKPSFPSENTLQLSFAFAFHQSRLNEAANRQLLLDTAERLTGRNLTIECVLDKNSQPSDDSSYSASPPPDDSLSTINNIFSGAELLES